MSVCIWWHWKSIWLPHKRCSNPPPPLPSLWYWQNVLLCDSAKHKQTTVYLEPYMDMNFEMYFNYRNAQDLWTISVIKFHCICKYWIFRQPALDNCGLLFKKKTTKCIYNIGHLFAIRHNMQIIIGFSDRISISVQSQINYISADKAISLKQACSK